MEQPGPNEDLVSYRLGEVEKAVKENAVATTRQMGELHLKLDKFMTLEREIDRNSFRLTSLETSRNRQMTFMLTTFAGLVLLFAQVFFKVI